MYFKQNPQIMHIYKHLAFIFILITLASCTHEPPILQEKTEYGKQGWVYGHDLEYHPMITDTDAAYVFRLKIQFTKDYPFNFLKLQLVKENNEGESYVKIFSIPVKDSNGVFLEKEEKGIYHMNAILSRQIYFSTAGKYHIQIKELMSGYYLKGIKSIEFNIQKRSK